MIAVVNRILNPAGETLFLLRKTKPFGWGLPGGKVEETDDTEMTACLRETYEETGLLLTSDYVTKIGESESVDGTVVIVFETILPYDPNVKRNSAEHLNHRWIKTHTNPAYQKWYTDDVRSLAFAGNTLRFLDLGRKISFPGMND